MFEVLIKEYPVKLAGKSEESADFSKKKKPKPNLTLVLHSMTRDYFV